MVLTCGNFILFQFSVLSALGGLSALGRVTSVTSAMLNSAKSQLKMLLVSSKFLIAFVLAACQTIILSSYLVTSVMQKLINLRGPIEDPSIAASASRSLIIGQTEGLLSYKATSNLVGSSHCCFSNWDIDSHLLALLKVCYFQADIDTSSCSHM